LPGTIFCRVQSSATATFESSRSSNAIQAQSRGSPAVTFPQHQLLQHQQPDAIITAGGSRTPVKWSSEYGDNCSVNSADKQTTQRRANVDYRDSVFCHPLDAVSGHSYLNVLRGNIGLRLFSVEFH
jgi:hypothetical protein